MKITTNLSASRNSLSRSLSKFPIPPDGFLGVSSPSPNLSIPSSVSPSTPASPTTPALPFFFCAIRPRRSLGSPPDRKLGACTIIGYWPPILLARCAGSFWEEGGERTVRRRSDTAASPDVGCGAGAVSENEGGRCRLWEARTSSLKIVGKSEWISVKLLKILKVIGETQTFAVIAVADTPRFRGNCLVY